MSLLSIRGLSKTFVGTQALRDVDFDLRQGEILGLVGQNGSGKSTLIKVLAGYHEPDPGATATLDGAQFDLGDAASASAAGVRFVHQDLGLVASLGALDNLALGRGYMRGRLGTIKWQEEARIGRNLLRDLGYEFDLDLPVERLQASERTGIAIARALQGFENDARVLVLDEPTAALPAAEVDRLFETVERVNRAGVSVIYVSHRFKEIFRLCDRVTVLKDGVNVGTRKVGELTEPGLVRLTIGRELDMVERSHAHAAPQSAGPGVLRLEGLSGGNVEHIDLEVAAGEVVGVAGVTGSGREVLAGLVVGAVKREGGRVEVAGKPTRDNDPVSAIGAGLAYVPAERLENAAMPDMSLRENLTIADLSPVYGALGLRRGVEKRDAAHWLREFDVKPQDTEARLINLSGGNQQKVMIARAMRLEPAVVVLDEPTQGVDVGAKRTIHDLVRQAAGRGAAVLVCATESEELVNLCDRVAVLVHGRCIGVFDTSAISADDLTELTMSVGVPTSDGEEVMVR